MFCVPATATLDADDTHGFYFAEGSGNHIVINAELRELFLGHYQITIALACMLSQFNLNAKKHQMTG
jgi:hypothetical protein